MKRFLTKTLTLLTFILIFCLGSFNVAYAKEGRYLFTEGNGEKIIQQAKKYYGRRYVWGANGPYAFDCSGLVTYVYRTAGVIDFRRYVADRPTTITYTDWFLSNNISHSVNTLEGANKGDIIIYYKANGVAGHMAIYNEGDMMIHAPQEGDVVRDATVESVIGRKYRNYIVYHIYENRGEMKLNSVNTDGNSINSVIKVTYPNGKEKLIDSKDIVKLKKLESGKYKFEQVQVDESYTINEEIKTLIINANSTIKNSSVTFENKPVESVLINNFYNLTHNVLSLNNNLSIGHMLNTK